MADPAPIAEARGGAAPEEVFVVTCSEPDATPFLRALPAEAQRRATLLATGDVVRAAEAQTAIGRTFVLGGPSTFAEARALLAAPGARPTVVVAPDPWGPLHGKGFLRARMVAPLLLPAGAAVDIVVLDAGGATGRVRHAVPAAAFTRWLRRREALLLVRYALTAGVADPAGRAGGPVWALLRLLLAPFRAAATLTVVLPYVLASEARARRSGAPR